jgi:DNA-directed RNA polymerase specialized sigma24 family protein
MTITEKVFKRYEKLAIQYANKIWNENKLSLEKEDLYQEMRIKLFLSIKTYAKRWKEYRHENARKPIPLEFYLRTAMANRVRDFISEINSAMDKGETLNFDKGAKYNELILSENTLKIGGENLEDIFLTPKEKRIFRLLVRYDFQLKEVDKQLICKRTERPLVEKCMETLKSYLQDNHSEYQEYFINEYQED